MLQLHLNKKYVNELGEVFFMFDKIGLFTYLGEESESGVIYTFNEDGKCISNPDKSLTKEL